MSHIDNYLTIPDEVARNLGGLTWSLDGDALKREDGTTFALTQEMILFLEGFALGRPLVPFGYLLLAFGLVRGRWGPKPGDSSAIDRLREAYHTTGHAERNAGSFFAVLLEDLPVALEPPQVVEIWRRAVVNVKDPLRLTTQTLIAPPLRIPSDVLLRSIESRLTPYSREDLGTWMKTGSGPVPDAARQLVEALAGRSTRSLEGLLGDRAERKRLAGAMPLIEQLSAALTLPPRKLTSPELPLGGYSDVTTHGHPDRLLLSQFALDELELMRRLAERELLYFRREEPRAEVREELIIVLDQGVRTWGASRLVLLAATFVLARIAEQRQQPFRVATTGRTGGAWNPNELQPEELARRLEVADLSPHPGLTLESVLEESVSQPRDIVLLTHPRTLDEPDVQAAASRLQSGARLFALTSDREGHAGLGEFQHGRCVPVRSFRVDLNVHPPRRTIDPDAPGWHPWQGDIEPYPCLFFLNPGAADSPRFAFDLGERHLLLALADGALMLVPLHGRAQMLPRARVDSGILRWVRWIQGVAGGFLVGGMNERGLGVVARYDLATCEVQAWTLALSGSGEGAWGYLPSLDCVVRWTPQSIQSLDLTTSEQRRQQHANPIASDPSRAYQALQVSPHDLQPGWLPDLADLGQKVHSRTWIDYDGRTGEITLGCPGETVEIQPMENGEPTLRDSRLRKAQWCGELLGLSLDLPAAPGRHAGTYLMVFQIPSGWLVHRIPSSAMASHPPLWTLSPSGQLLVYTTGEGQAAIRGNRPDDARMQITPRSRLDRQTEFSLGSGWLGVTSAGSTHLVHWHGERLVIEPVPGRFTLRLEALGLSPNRASWSPAPPTFLENEPDRFPRVLLGRLILAIESTGVASLFDFSGLLLAQVCARGPKVAIASPQGDAIGDSSILGRPTTLDAPQRLAMLFRSAERETPEVNS